VSWVGATPKLVDVDTRTHLLDAEHVAAAIGPRTRAVIPVHLMGSTVDLDPVIALAREHDLRVIEDTAQAHGADHRGRRVGGIGDIGCFSFYPTKNLGGWGDGGAIVTNDAALAAQVARLRMYGWDGKYDVVTSGGRNSRLDELQAAVLRVRLPRLDDVNAARRSIVRRYAEALPDEAARFVARDGEDYVAHLAVLVADEPLRVAATLDRAKIATEVHYRTPDHRQDAWRGDYRDTRLPVSEHACDHVLTLPCFPELTHEEIDRVCEVLGGL
jgi:dTDP-4-amino-4,6-dideoxygalactose transaminase